METFTKLFGSLLLFVHRCFDPTSVNPHHLVKVGNFGIQVQFRRVELLHNESLDMDKWRPGHFDVSVCRMSRAGSSCLLP
jgi:hypothetical protein